MSNKFKIRNLENEKRNLDKQIAKLKAEVRKDETYKHLTTVTEKRVSQIVSTENSTEKENIYTYDFYQQGDRVICIFSDDYTNIRGKGVATCCEEDTFNLSVGCIIAERRAVVNYYKEIEEIEVGRH
ncbi:MAG: hypothetical protein ACRCX2_20090 [Paraclostridium sp.]